MRFPEHSPNSHHGIDVEGQDGLMFHGVVVDLNGSDLVIDLQTKLPSRITVPCSRAFHAAHSLTPCLLRERDEEGEHIDRDEDAFIQNLLQRHSEVVVVLQVSEDRQWTWYPGTLQAVCRFGFAIVELKDSEIWNGRLVVPCDHVRFGGDDGRLAITEATFSKKWLAEARTEQVTSAHSQTDTKDVHAPDVINTMPVELSRKTFSFFDIYQQTQIRSVCKTWYDFSPLCKTTDRRSIWIDTATGPRFRGDMDYVRKFGACLLQYYNPGLQTIILSGEMSHYHRYGGPGNGDPIQEAGVLVALAYALKTLTIQTALKLPIIKRLVLSGCRIQPDAFFFSGDGLCSDLKAVCETLVRDGAVLAFAGEDVEVLGGITLHGQIDLQTPGYNENFWEILDGAVLTLSSDDVKGVEMWIEKLYQSSEQLGDTCFTERTTRQMVQMYQGLDPRPGAFHIEDFEDPSLFSDLTKFHNLTMAMLRAKSKEPMDD